MTKARKGDTFTNAKASTAALAMRPSALSLFWLFGCGTDNEARGRTMIVTVSGPLEQRASWWDGYDAILDRFREACDDDSTTAIVLRLDSPGGECAGLNECVRLMLEAKAASGKRVVAYADESAYSAAYALACVADEVYLPPSGGVGSVGVIATCLSRSRMMQEIGIDVAVVHAGARKADCHPDLPLSDDALAGVQADVDALAVMFRELVATSRGVEVDAIAALEAATFMGEEAIAAGLADGVMGFDELVAMLDGDSADSDTKPSGTSALNEGTKIMGATATTPTPKKARGAVQKASDVGASDALARPQTATADPAELEGVAAALAGKPTSAPAAVVVPRAADSSGDVSDDDDDDEEGGEEESTSTETETTTTTTTTTDEGEGEEGDDDEEDDDEEEGASALAPRLAPIAAAPIVPRNATSATVLKLVAELTGETSPAAQFGALHAMRDKAAKVDELEVANRKARKAAKATELKSIVDGAIRAGTLEPARKAWAMTQSVASITAYLKGSKGAIVPRSPLRQKSTKGPARTEQPAAGEPVVDEAIANVARAMQMDPAKVAAHAADLRKAGVIH